MPTYGQRPDDVVQDSRGNTLRGVTIELYGSAADAAARTSPVGSAVTDGRGRWSFDSDSSELWARVPDGTVWKLANNTPSATPEQLAAESAARSAADLDIDARLDALEAGGGGGGVTDHGQLTGLDVDSHPQYHTDARGDARYHTRAEVTSLLSGKAASSHTHAVADTTGLQAALDGKAASSHTHTATGISDSTTTGRALLTAADAAAARAAIGAGTGSSNLTLGTTAGTAKAGDYQPAWADVTGKPSTFTPSTHGHAIADTTGLQTALDGKAASAHTHGVTDLTATGTRNSTTFLRGDNVWATPAGGGGSSPLGAKFVNVQDHGAVGDGVTNDTAAIVAARDAAGVGGTVFFPRTANAYLTDPIKPLSYQTWEGQHSLRYAWDNTQNGGSILRARTTQSAVFYNDNNTSNGVTTQAARGVTVRSLGIQGGPSFAGRVARGIDLGQTAGPERGWTITNCHFAFCTTAIAGYVWACQVTANHFTRNGYGFAPDQGVDTAGRANDCMITNNYFYFNLNHAIQLSGSVESGLTTIAFNRVERGGANVTGSATYDPTGAPANTFACGIYITRATCISIVGNSSDANTGPGLCIRAVAHGLVNNIQSVGNVWKRDGIGTNDGAAQLAGLEVKDTAFCQFRDNITYGDPNDSGAGVIAPYYGFQYEANDWLKFDGSAQLDTNGNTTSRGIRSVGSANWMCSITDQRQPVLGFPAAATASAPTAGLQQGSAYYDTTLDTIRVWDGAAWDNMGGGGTSDHGALTGLADDDHPQYSLADGSRGNVWVINSPTGWGTYAGPPPAGTVVVRY